MIYLFNTSFADRIGIANKISLFMGSCIIYSKPCKWNVYILLGSKFHVQTNIKCHSLCLIKI